MSHVIAPEIAKALLATRDRLQADGKLVPHDKLDAYLARFREKFGPDALNRLDGEALLDAMHGHKTKDSLVYWLEFKDEDDFSTRPFGGVGGGSALKFGIYRRAEDGAWIAGYTRKPRELTVDEAIGRARQHRTQIVRGTALLERLPPSATDADYERLQSEMEAAAPDLSDSAWGHKYFTLLFPDKLDPFHVRNWQDWHLIHLLQLPPQLPGRFVCAGRFVGLARQLDMLLNHVALTLNHHHGPHRGFWITDLASAGDTRATWFKEGMLGFPGLTLGDISKLPTAGMKDSVRAAVAAAYPHLEARAQGRRATELRSFRVARVGDQVLVLASGQIVALGRIEGDYEFEERHALAHRRAVKWQEVEPFRLPIPEGVGGLFDKVARAENLIEVRRRVLGSPEVVRPPLPPEPEPVGPEPGPQPGPRPVPRLKHVAGRVQAALERKGQAILYGPPGTGKTYWALRTACDLAAHEEHGVEFEGLSAEQQAAIRGPGKRVQVVSFHPGYGYEDFLEGYRPEAAASGTMTFVRRDGLFKTLCRDADGRRDRSFFLVIDEINRGDVPRIFGELLTSLERDKRDKDITLPVSGAAFRVPANVLVIGTMNTADRSIALLDVALRRRFGFVELMPEPELLDESRVGGLPLGDWLRRLNARICQRVRRDARNLQIGHAYFMEGDKAIRDVSRFARVLREDVIPLLEEHCYEDYATLAEILGPRIVDTKAQRVFDELFAPDQGAELVNALLALDPELATSTHAVAADEAEDGEAEDGAGEELSADASPVVIEAAAPVPTLDEEAEGR